VPRRGADPRAHVPATKPDGAEFLGVNIYDGPERATSFEEKYGISYPSLLAKDDADLKLAFAEWTSVQATPTTLVSTGRRASRRASSGRSRTTRPPHDRGRRAGGGLVSARRTGMRP
jgi:hypothetical protein